MATVYTAPIPPPEPNYKNYDFNVENAREEAYYEELRVMARKGDPDPIIGEIVRWPRADGYAQYMVWRTKPLQLVWIEVGDAWRVEDALIRGLRITDVRRMVEGERRLNALFSKKEVS